MSVARVYSRLRCEEMSAPKEASGLSVANSRRENMAKVVNRGVRLRPKKRGFGETSENLIKAEWTGMSAFGAPINRHTDRPASIETGSRSGCFATDHTLTNGSKWQATSLSHFAIYIYQFTMYLWTGVEFPPQPARLRRSGGRPCRYGRAGNRWPPANSSTDTRSVTLLAPEDPD